MIRFARLTLVLASALVLTAACGSSDDGGTSKASGDAFANCLKSNGVDMSGMMPSGRPSGVRPSGVRPSGAGRPSGMRQSGAGRPNLSGGPGGPGWGNQQAPAGVDASTWQHAIQVCASLRPSGDRRNNGDGGQGGPGGQAPGDTGSVDNGADAAYLNCMRDHGATATAVADLKTGDPAVASATQACAALKPAAAAPSPAAT